MVVRTPAMRYLLIGMSRSVVLTGASSGIGEALAVQLARRGDRLALLARRRAELERVRQRALDAAEAAGQADPVVSAHPVDVTDRTAVHGILAEIERTAGVDLLVLNAGISENTEVSGFDDRLAARTLEVNLTSTVYALGAVLPGMVERRRGHVVGVSSIAGYRGLPGAAAYCASKAGFSTLLESLRIDLRRHGIAVTTVSPGFVRTPMTDKNRHPMPFLMEVDRAAEVIARGIDRRAREIRFPWQLTAMVRLLRALPDWLYEALATRVQRPTSSHSPSDPFAGAR